MAWVLKGNLRGPAGFTGPSGAAGIVQSVVGGTNVTVDSTNPAAPVVSASGGSGSGIVETVVGTTNQIDVNSTDPANPILTLSAAVLAALAMAATAVQPGANVSVFTNDAGYITSAALPSPANPTASLGLTAVNGVASTYMRSDGAPALSQAITPTWTNVHTFSSVPVVPNDSWAYAKIQNVSATSRVLGRISSGAGDIEELTAANLVTIIGSGGVVGANPSATIGLSTVNGSATSYMRSDGAPALSQAIVPTWSGAHTFTAAPIITADHLEINNTDIYLQLRATGAAADTKMWWLRNTAGALSLQTRTDVGGAGRNLIAASRSGVAVTALDFGNATDNAPYTFLGTGAFSVSGTSTFNRASGVVNMLWTDGTVVTRYYSSGSSTIANFGVNSNHAFNILQNDIARLTFAASGAGATFSVPTTINGLLTVASGAGQQVWLQNDAAFISFYNTAGTTRRGYLQMSTGGAVTLASEQSAQALNFSTNAGSINMDSPLTVTSGTSPQIAAVASGASNAYLTARRTAPTGAEVGVLLNGGTGGVSWYVYQPAASNALEFYGNGQTRVRFPGTAQTFATHSTGATGNNYWQWCDSTGANKGYIGYGSSGSDQIQFVNEKAAGIDIYTTNILRATFNAGGGSMLFFDATNPYVGLSRAGVVHYLEAVSGEVHVYGASGCSSALQSNAGANSLTLTSAGALNLNSFPVRGSPRRTSGFANGEVLAVSAGVTLNTSDLVAGYIFTVYNDSAAAITITQGAGVTLRLVGTATSGSRSLAARGLATIWVNTTAEAIAAGVT